MQSATVPQVLTKSFESVAHQELLAYNLRWLDLNQQPPKTTMLSKSCALQMEAVSTPRTRSDTTYVRIFITLISILKLGHLPLGGHMVSVENPGLKLLSFRERMLKKTFIFLKFS